MELIAAADHQAEAQLQAVQLPAQAAAGRDDGRPSQAPALREGAATSERNVSWLKNKLTDWLLVDDTWLYIDMIDLNDIIWYDMIWSGLYGDMICDMVIWYDM